MLGQQPAIQAGGASTADPADLRLAAAAVCTAGDAIARYRAIEAPRDHGLRGGTVSASGEGSVLTLAADQLVGGVRVSGALTVSPISVATGGESVSASLTVRSALLPGASFTASWSTAGEVAQVSGEVAGQSVWGTTRAP